MITKIAINDIEVGMPATHYVGSDRYGCVVTRVDKFTTGAKRGQVKAVWADDTKFLVTPTFDGDRLIARYEGKKAWWRTLSVGEAVDYQDPHF